MPPLLLLGLVAIQSALPPTNVLCDGVWGDLLKDPAVKDAIDDAWKKTKEGTPDEHEVGGMVYRCNTAEGPKIQVKLYEGGKTDGELPYDPDPGCTLIGFFHTHPGTGEDGKYIYDKPSDTDIGTSASFQVPGLLISGEGSDPSKTKKTAFHGGGRWELCKEDEKPPPPPAKDPPKKGWSFGDPHMTTFDGYQYDFQAAGEFVLARSTTDDFEVQTRQEPPSPAASTVTVNTAVVARIDGSVIEVSESRLVVDGEERVRPPRETIETPGGGTVEVTPEAVTFRWSDGTEVLADGWLVIVTPVDARAGALEGLLGDFDGDRENDLVGPGGQVLGDRGIVSFDDLHGGLYDAWRVTDETSLFTYKDGESTADYTIEGYPRAPALVGFLTDEQRESAHQTCVGAGVDEERLLLDCMLDVGTTGDSSYATEAARLPDLVRRAGRGSEDPPLVVAARGGRLADVQRLLGEGADPDSTDANGRSALALSAAGGYLDVLRTLLEAGADPDLAADDGQTALHAAATWGHADAVTLLAGAGGDPTLTDESGETPLMLAAEQGSAAAVQALLDAGAPVDTQADDGRSALALAVIGGDVYSVRALLDAGADPDLPDSTGATPLHGAALWGFADIARALLDAGADPDLENDSGQTPLDIAEAQGNDDVAELLR